jgi:hypothetical protein
MSISAPVSDGSSPSDELSSDSNDEDGNGASEGDSAMQTTPPGTGTPPDENHLLMSEALVPSASSQSESPTVSSPELSAEEEAT